MNHAITRWMRSGWMAGCLLLGLSLAPQAAAQTAGTAFTYQGRLSDAGSPANGPHDFQLVLYTAAVGGSQVGPVVTLDDVAVVDGLFTTTLDFDSGAFDGDARFLEIGVRLGSSTGGYTLLGSRQELTPAPHTVFSQEAPWTGVTGKPSGFADDTDNDVLGGLTCANGQVAKWNGAAWACAADTDTTYTAGAGLDLAGTTFSVADLGVTTAKLANDSVTSTKIANGTIVPADLSGNACPALQILKTNGSAWGCAADADSGGDITGVTAGTGLTGGGASGGVTLSASFAGSGAAGTVSHSDHDHFGQIWSPTSPSFDGLTIEQFDTSSGRAGVVGIHYPSASLGSGLFGRSHSTLGVGVQGMASATTGSSAGVDGVSLSPAGRGVVGRAITTSGANYGVYGSTASSAGSGVYGEATATNGTNSRGVLGTTSSTAGRGVYGQATATTGTTYGVYGLINSTSSFSAGVYGEAFNGFGVYGQSSTGNGVRGRTNSGLAAVYGDCQSSTGSGVRGLAVPLSGQNYGVYGASQSSSGTGVLGIGTSSSGLNYGVYGWTLSTAGYAGYFQGRVHVNGTLSKSAGAFKIDHPLDPENKYLSHSFVESPDMMNVYNGNATTDDDGFATVRLPDWFQALNRDFRYQLTVLDEGDSGVFVQVKVVKKVAENRFTIRTSMPRTEVSWQVTGIRKDPFAEKHRIPVEEVKPEGQRGQYLNPVEWGVPEERGIHYERHRALEQPEPQQPTEDHEPGWDSAE